MNTRSTVVADTFNHYVEVVDASIISIEYDVNDKPTEKLVQSADNVAIVAAILTLADILSSK